MQSTSVIFFKKHLSIVDKFPCHVQRQKIPAPLKRPDTSTQSQNLV